MITNTLTFQAHAKCILSGEHAVLRGHPAIVLPIPQFIIRLNYHDTDTPLTTDVIGDHGESLLMMFWGTIKKACEMVDVDINQIRGNIQIENHIPLCAGLGCSAALCLIIGHWFISQNWLTENKLFEFARKLEDKFHQESSGVDIAGVSSNLPVYYVRNKVSEVLDIKWQPHLYLSYSNHISVTAEAVETVKKLFSENKLRAKRIDLDMAESTILAKDAFMMSKEHGIMQLAKAIEQACHCFEQWGLMTNKIRTTMESLSNAGALACKPTGAGFGGYVLSLWEEAPKLDELPFELLPVFPSH